MIQELTDKIKTWAIVRGLEQAETDKQMLKLGEEFGELCSAMARGEEDKATDAIGDMFVVLTILSLQRGIPIESCVMHAYKEIKDRKGEMVNGVFIKEDDLIANRRN